MGLSGNEHVGKPFKKNMAQHNLAAFPPVICNVLNHDQPLQQISCKKGMEKTLPLRHSLVMFVNTHTHAHTHTFLNINKLAISVLLHSDSL